MRRIGIPQLGEEPGVIGTKMATLIVIGIEMAIGGTTKIILIGEAHQFEPEDEEGRIHNFMENNESLFLYKHSFVFIRFYGGYASWFILDNVF